MSHHEINVVTYNIHKGFTARNQAFVLSEIRDAIRLTGADIVGVQEILGEHNGHSDSYHNWEAESHFEYLADSMWPHNSYGKNAIYRQGHHGNALLSKYPIHRSTNHDISQWWFSRRGILHGEILDNLHIACLHIGFLPLEQRRQLRRLQQWLDRYVPPLAPLIVMGDFNDWHNQIHKAMLKMGFSEATSHNRAKPAKTYPASKPRLAMDRIYYRGLELADSQVLNDSPWNHLSDHCPIQAKFLL